MWCILILHAWIRLSFLENKNQISNYSSDVIKSFDFHLASLLIHLHLQFYIKFIFYKKQKRTIQWTNDPAMHKKDWIIRVYLRILTLHFCQIMFPLTSKNNLNRICPPKINKIGLLCSNVMPETKLHCLTN